MRDTRLRNVIAAAMYEAYRYDASGADADDILKALDAAGYKVTLRDPCRCGCGKRSGEHLCPCGCGHTYEDAVSKVMSGPMYLNWEQASANIDEHPDVPCKSPT